MYVCLQAQTKHETRINQHRIHEKHLLHSLVALNQHDHSFLLYFYNTRVVLFSFFPIRTRPIVQIYKDVESLYM